MHSALQIHPTAKSSILYLSFFFLSTLGYTQESMRATLYAQDASGLTVLDGNLTDYGTSYCNCIDWDDAAKMTNPGENLGILRDGVNLVIERRKELTGNDTTTFRIWNLQQNRNYKIVISMMNFTNVNFIVYMKDTYTGNLVPLGLNADTEINFTINSSTASSVSSRFQMVYEAVGGSLPVHFTGINAMAYKNDINVAWHVENEIGLKEYVVERSLDGRNFAAVKNLAAGSKISADYQVGDYKGKPGVVYYRVKATSLDGNFQYSNIASANVEGGNDKASVIVYPNPVVNRMLGLRVENAGAGAYAVQMYSGGGRMISIKEGASLVAGTNALKIAVPHSATPGTYLVVLTGRNRSRISTLVNVL